jgi:hypothetical protein
VADTTLECIGISRGAREQNPHNHRRRNCVRGSGDRSLQAARIRHRREPIAGPAACGGGPFARRPDRHPGGTVVRSFRWGVTLSDLLVVVVPVVRRLRVRGPDRRACQRHPACRREARRWPDQQAAATRPDASACATAGPAASSGSSSAATTSSTSTSTSTSTATSPARDRGLPHGQRQAQGITKQERALQREREGPRQPRRDSRSRPESSHR